jgi:hypothetical protein
VIPAEAVEAAYAAINYPDRRAIDYDEIKIILEAAAPHMLAAAWDEGEQAGAMNHAAEEYPEVKDITNPHRSQA